MGAPTQDPRAELQVAPFREGQLEADLLLGDGGQLLLGMPEGFPDAPHRGLSVELQHNVLLGLLTARNDRVGVLEIVGRVGKSGPGPESLPENLQIPDPRELEDLLLLLLRIVRMEVPAAVAHEEERGMKNPDPFVIVCLGPIPSTVSGGVRGPVDEGDLAVLQDGLVQNVEVADILPGDLGASLKAEVNDPGPLLPVGGAGEDAEGALETLHHALADRRVLVGLEALAEEMDGEEILLADPDHGEMLLRGVEGVLLIRVLAEDFARDPAHVLRGDADLQKRLHGLDVALDGPLHDAAEFRQLGELGPPAVLELREDGKDPEEMVPGGVVGNLLFSFLGVACLLSQFAGNSFPFARGRHLCLARCRGFSGGACWHSPHLARACHLGKGKEGGAPQAKPAPFMTHGRFATEGGFCYTSISIRNAYG